MIKVSDIPSELMSKIRFQFDNDSQVQRLRVQQGMAQRGGDYAEALRLGKMIDVLYNEVVYNYIKEAQQQVEQVEIGKLGIPLEAKERILTLGIVLFMTSDIIETAIKDIDDVMQKYDKDLHFEMFNDMRELSSMAKEKLKFFSKNSDYMKDSVWGDTCDNMYKMICNKARSLMRKRKDCVEWGGEKVN